MAFLALVLATGGFAIAANDTATTSAVKKKVKACYAKKTGELRVTVKGKRKCRRGEKKLVWNKKGVRGPAGPQGATGATGATGPAGPQGPAGLSGGSGGGGVTLGPGTVGEEHIADGSITVPKLAPDLITDDLLGLVIEYAESANNSNSPKSVYAECPVGTQLVGGGGGPTDGLFIPLSAVSSPTTIYNGPTIGNDWFVSAYEVLGFGSNWQVTAYAICIRS